MLLPKFPSNGKYAPQDIERCTWLYYKLRNSDKSSQQLDLAIIEVIPAVLRCWSFSRWFFLRYLDTVGLHLRLRLMCPIAELQNVEDSIASVFHHWTGQIEKDVYVQDAENFGQQGVLVAEALFQASSEVATSTLIGEREGHCSRKTLAPIFMQCIADTFVRKAAHTWFWERYAGYWLNEKSGRSASSLRSLFDSKADELTSRRISVVTPLRDLSQTDRDRVEHWRGALQESANRFAELKERPARRRSHLAFHFIHLMNNRLGIRPMAESYLASLMARQRMSFGL